MKKGKILKIAFLISVVVWTVMLIKQQSSLTQYKKELDVLSSKIDVAEDELNQNKEELKQKEIDIQSPEYIEQLAREKLGMYLENERVYVDSNM